MTDEVCKRCGVPPGELCRTPAGYKLAARHGSGPTGRVAKRSPHRRLHDAGEAARKWRNKEQRARQRIKELEAEVAQLRAELAELRSDPVEVKKRLYGNAKWRALGGSR